VLLSSKVKVPAFETMVFGLDCPHHRLRLWPSGSCADRSRANGRQALLFLLSLPPDHSK
jgi:hypothetical protein